MTATDTKPHPLYTPFKHRLGYETQAGRKLNWSADYAYTGGRRGWQGRVFGKLVAVTWKGYFIDSADTLLLTIETAGPVTVFTLSDKGGPGGRTRHLDSFTCPSDVNGLFLIAIDQTAPFAAPLADYLMERECPPDILAFFW